MLIEVTVYIDASVVDFDSVVVTVDVISAVEVSIEVTVYIDDSVDVIDSVVV